MEDLLWWAKHHNGNRGKSRCPADMMNEAIKGCVCVIQYLELNPVTDGQLVEWLQNKERVKKKKKTVGEGLWVVRSLNLWTSTNLPVLRTSSRWWRRVLRRHLNASWINFHIVAVWQKQAWESLKCLPNPLLHRTVLAVRWRWAQEAFKCLQNQLPSCAVAKLWMPPELTHPVMNLWMVHQEWPWTIFSWTTNWASLWWILVHELVSRPSLCRMRIISIISLIPDDNPAALFSTSCSLPTWCQEQICVEHTVCV